MRRLLLVFLFALAPLSNAAAQTLTVKDIVGLTKAGLSDEVLLALIEVHRPIFPIDPETIKMLKESGVPQAVIVAMVRSGREQPPVEIVPNSPPTSSMTSAAPAPPVVIVERERAEEPRVREVAVPVAVPVYVPVRVRPRHDDVPPPTRQVEAVYWGFGGKLRPDAWQPTPQRTKHQKDLKPGEVQKK